MTVQNFITHVVKYNEFDWTFRQIDINENNLSLKAMSEMLTCTLNLPTAFDRNIDN